MFGHFTTLCIKGLNKTIGNQNRVKAATVKIYNSNSSHQFINRLICKLQSSEIRPSENFEKDEIITDQTIVDNNITQLYELNQQPNRLTTNTSTLI